MSDLIAYHLEDGIATLTLSNGKVNAISPDVITAFNAALDQAEQDRGVAALAGSQALQEQVVAPRGKGRGDREVKREQGEEHDLKQDEFGPAPAHLLSRVDQIAAQGEGDKRQRTGQGGHQDRIQSVQRTAYHAVVHSVPFFLLQMVVMAYQQHTVSGGDTEQ